MPGESSVQDGRPARARIRRAAGTVLFLAGYLLSPLTWWNDAFVNLPIAWAAASAASWIAPALFTPALVLAYWATNLLGLLLMGAGGVEAAGRGYPRRPWRTLLFGSAAYTILILLLIWLGWVRPLPAFWRGAG